MAEINRLTGTMTERQGYRVVTRSAGDEYVTTFRRVDDEDTDARIVAPTERVVIDGDTGVRERADVKATEAVVEALAEIDVEVRE